MLKQSRSFQLLVVAILADTSFYSTSLHLKVSSPEGIWDVSDCVDFFHFFVDEKQVNAKIKQKVEADLKLIDSTALNCICKAWLYEFPLLQRQSWPFLTHDLDRNLAEELKSLATRYLTKWLRICITADPGVLYRSKDHFGMLAGHLLG